MYEATVVIPTKNEAGNNSRLVNELQRVFSDTGKKYQIIVVDNNSDDGTVEEVRGLQERLPVELVSICSDDGLSRAVLEGAARAGSDNIVIMDGDLSHPPETVPELAAELKKPGHVMAIGSRYIENISMPDWPLFRRVISHLGSIPARMFTDVRDPLSGFIAVKKEYLLEHGARAKGFKFGLQLLASRSEQERVSEVPIVFRDRCVGRSKLGCRVVFQYFRQLFCLGGGNTVLLGSPLFYMLLVLGALADFSLSFFLGVDEPVRANQHLFGGLLNLALPFFFLSLRPQSTRHKVANAWYRFLLCLLFFVPIRGGILVFLLDVIEFSPFFSLIGAVIFSTFYSMLLLLVFICSSNPLKLSTTTHFRIFAAFGFCYFLFLRFFYLGSFELLEEEAYYWNYAKHLDYGYLDHPPMIALFIWIGTFFFGDTEFGVRFVSFLAWLLTSFFVYRTSHHICRVRIGLTALLLISLFPFYFGIGMLATPDAPLTMCWAGTIYFLTRVLVAEKRGSWVGVSLFLGLGMLSKYTIVLLGPAIVLYMLFDRKSRKWFFLPDAYLAAIGAFILFLPVIIWNMNHDWASFVFQGKNRVEGLTTFSTPLLFLTMLLLITPYGVLGFVHFLSVGRKLFIKSSDFVYGKRSYLFILLMVMAPFSVFLLFSFTKQIKTNWTGPLWVALIPYMGWLLHCTTRPLGVARFPGFFCRTFATIIILCSLLIAYAPHYLSIGLPGIPDQVNAYTGGWADLAEKVERKVSELERENGRRPVVIGMNSYQIASGISFYRHKLREKQRPGDRNFANVALQETASSNTLGFGALMYDYWFPQGTFKNRDLLIVGRNTGQVSIKFGLAHGIAKKYEKAEKWPVYRNGKPFGHYYSRFLENYTLLE